MNSNTITSVRVVLKNLHDVYKSDALIASAIAYAAMGLNFIEMNRYEKKFNDFVDKGDCELTDSEINHLRSLDLLGKSPSKVT